MDIQWAKTMDCQSPAPSITRAVCCGYPQMKSEGNHENATKARDLHGLLAQLEPAGFGQFEFRANLFDGIMELESTVWIRAIH